MAFLTKDELKTRSHAEVIDAITRGDDTIIDMIIGEMTSYVKSFLSARYDIETIFSATGDDRDQVVLKILKDLVIYEIYSSHNPNMMTEVIKTNMERADTWLKMVQKEKVNPALPDSDTAGKEPILYGGNTRRTSHY